MKTTAFSFILILVVLLSACSEKLHELTVDASNGKTTFSTSDRKGKTDGQAGPQKKTQYIRKGKALTIKMENISPNDSLVLSVAEDDVRITGDQAKDPLKDPEEQTQTETKDAKIPLITAKEIATKKESTDKLLSDLKTNLDTLDTLEKKLSEYKPSTSDQKTAGAIKNLKKNIDSLKSKIKKQKTDLKDAQRELDSLSFVYAINYSKDQLSQLSISKNAIKDNAQRSRFILLLENSENVCTESIKTLQGKELEFPDLSSELTQCANLFFKLRSEVESMVFEREQTFFPSKEEFTVSIKKYQRNNKTGNPEELVNLTFIQYKRFKIFSSAGMHCMLFNGKYAGIYGNKDSIIVRRNGNNIVPSFGTYLNGTWRLDDCLMGISLGIGIPLQFTSNVDMTPNFNLLWTTNFQNQYGRFGINAGFGIQKVNVLAPGFNVGDNLRVTNTDVPLRAIWTPTFGIGVSYNIGDRE